MRQSFAERFVAIEQAGIFADHSDSHFAFGMTNGIDDVLPARQVWLFRRRQVEVTHHLFVKALLVIAAGDIVNRIDIERGNDAFLFDITEQADFLAFRFGNWLFGAAKQNFRLNVFNSPAVLMYGSSVTWI